MPFSTVTYLFNSLPSADEQITITNDLSTTPILEVFKVFRSSNAQSTIGIETTDSASNLNAALNADYTSGGLYTIVWDTVDSVTITALQDGVTFVETTNTTGGAVTITINNEAATPELTIDTVAYSEADSSPCANVKVTVTTSELATKITSPIEVDPNTDNPFEFDWIRGATINIACETASLSVTENYTLPDTLSVANMTLTQVTTPNGATLTVTHTDVSGLTLQYKIDAGDYQSSPTFTGLVEAIYILYVKDQLGCTIQKDFSVSVFTPDISVTTAEFSLSKSMSIRYKEDVTWADCSDYKNEENTLSCEYNERIPYRTYQQFQSCDTITTQFRSNFTSNTANVINADGSEDALTVVKRTTFLEKKDKRGGIYYNYNDTQTGIYFRTGKRYNYSTGADLDDDHALNGLLPEWGVVGNYIHLDGIGWYEIVEIITDESLDADVLLIDYIYSGSPTSIIVSSTYNLFNYDIYEFNLDMSAYNNTTIQVEVLVTHDDFTNRRKISEKIKVQTRWSETIDCYYWNPTNTDVYYASGIKNRIRIPFETFKPDIDGNIEGLDTDTNSILLNSELYETNILVTSPVSVGIMRQITQALLHKEVYLDDVKCRITELPEVEPHGDTNLLTITATFKKSGNVYNSELEGAASSDSTDTELTGLISGGTKYLKLS